MPTPISSRRRHYVLQTILVAIKYIRSYLKEEWLVYFMAAYLAVLPRWGLCVLQNLIFHFFPILNPNVRNYSLWFTGIFGLPSTSKKVSLHSGNVLHPYQY